MSVSRLRRARALTTRTPPARKPATIASHSSGSPEIRTLANGRVTVGQIRADGAVGVGPPGPVDGDTAVAGAVDAYPARVADEGT